MIFCESTLIEYKKKKKANERYVINLHLRAAVGWLILHLSPLPVHSDHFQRSLLILFVIRLNVLSNAEIDSYSHMHFDL